MRVPIIPYSRSPFIEYILIPTTITTSTILRHPSILTNIRISQDLLGQFWYIVHLVYILMLVLWSVLSFVVIVVGIGIGVMFVVGYAEHIR